jgi:hypothetical protein
MRTWTLRLGMSLMVVVGFWTNGLRAQEILVVPTVPYEPDQHERAYLPLGLRPQPRPADHLARRLLNSHGLGCQDDSYATCGSWRYEARFIFGSCRAFFDQSCAPNQPCADRRAQR